jgi:hypothetical protein
MAEVQLLDIGEIEQEVFTRWDITGHQVTRHLLSRALTGPMVWSGTTRCSRPVSSTTCTGTRTLTCREPRRRITRTCPCHPAGELHQISNVSSGDSQVLHFFAGVGSVEEIG